MTVDQVGYAVEFAITLLVNALPKINIDVVPTESTQNSTTGAPNIHSGERDRVSQGCLETAQALGSAIFYVILL